VVKEENLLRSGILKNVEVNLKGERIANVKLKEDVDLQRENKFKNIIKDKLLIYVI
jgi:hypothetical protein